MDKVILLIDDDEEEHELFLTALEQVSKNCVFLTASGTEEALRVLDRIIPDFIFLDVNMPAKNGFACLWEIKHNDNSRNVPVEMYSNSNDEIDKKTAISLGACGYLVKAESFRQLCTAVKDVLTAQKLI
jgi:DNA-binding response OmpR family regulator